MSYQLLSMVTRRAAKKHKCIWCGEAIEAGENYCDERSVYDGDMQSFHWHLECRDGAEAGWQGGDDGEFMSYRQERPQRAAAQEDALRCAVGNCKFNGEVDKHSPNCANTAAPVKRTVWVNLYGRQLESVCHPTEEDADKHASPNRIGGKAYPLEIEE